MTTEEKAKAYDNIIEKANKMHGENCEACQICIEELIPELAESEDEKIRGAIIDHLKDSNLTEWAAWLEKQGEQKPNIEIKSAEESLGIDSGTYNKIVDECIYGEQKPADKSEPTDYNSIDPYFGKPTDKVEPKFKVGDWVIYECGEETATLQITRIVGGTYVFSDDSTLGVVDEDTLRLWYITKDAKDGDVLTWDGTTCVVLFKNIKNSKCFVSYCSANDITFEIGTIHYIEGCHPATKEQRDLLFTKMKEAGYEWYDEKKELKEVEQNTTQETASFDEYEGLTDFERTLADICIGWIGQELGWKQYIKDNADVLLKIAIKKFNSVQDTTFEQKPAVWSEEDKEMLNLIIAVFEVNHPNGYFKANELNDPNMRAVYTEEIVAWLKSFKPQKQWKPSEEQMMALSDINLTGCVSYAGQGQELINLYNDLKKLKE